MKNLLLLTSIVRTEKETEDDETIQDDADKTVAQDVATDGATQDTSDNHKPEIQADIPIKIEPQGSSAFAPFTHWPHLLALVVLPHFL